MSAQKISAALDKAKNICIVEESVEIAGNILVVRSLRPAEYESIIKSISGLAIEAEYLNAWQRAYVCYALVEVNGVDLRGVDFIEVEETDAKGVTKTVKLETPTYLRDYLVSTWSKEAVYTVYRKVGDAISRAESEASNNIKFLVAEESPEDTYRRLASELKEIEDEVPPAIVDSILDENGLMRKSTAAEVKAAMERDSAAGWAEVQRKKQEAEVPPPPAAPIIPCDESIADPLQKGARIACEEPRDHAGDHMGRGLTWERVEPKAATRPTPPVGTPLEYEKRVPLNQVAVDLPRPSAAQRDAVPVRTSSKAAEFAALELAADQIGAISGDTLNLPEAPKDIPMLNQRQPGRSSKEAMAELNKAPVLGLNPKYRAR